MAKHQKVQWVDAIHARCSGKLQKRRGLDSWVDNALTHSKAFDTMVLQVLLKNMVARGVGFDD